MFWQGNQYQSYILVNWQVCKVQNKVAYHHYEESISKKLENLDVISAKESQVMFDGTQMSTDLGIYTIGKGRFWLYKAIL